MQRTFKITSVFAAVLLMASTATHAVGFGRASSTATLGQPLNFTVGLRQDAGDEFGAECVSADVHVGDNRLGPQNVRVSIEPGRGTSAERVLHVRTQSVIDEPVVTITLVVGCPPTLTRQFVTLADPPIVTLAERAPEPTGAPAPQPADARGSEPSAGEPAVRSRAAERVAAAPAAEAPTPRKRVAPRASGETTTRRATVAVPPVPQLAQGPAVAAPVQRDVAPEVGDRLKVDPAQRAPQPAGKAEARAATAADAAAAVTAVEGATNHMLAVLQAEIAARAADGERLRLLEESFNKLQADLRANTAEMAALRARVQQGEGERFSSSLVYGLAGLSTLLSLVLGALLLKRSRESDRRWWTGGAPPGPDTRAPAAPAVAPAPVAAAARSAAPVSKPVPLHSLASEPAGGVVVEEVHSRPAALSPETRPADAQPRREVTVEELIDLEQQAEFFVVLGQEEAAIDLLMNHLRNTGGISPLPYLKLLEIYRERGDRDSYERMRERFNRRFNAYAPEWDAVEAVGRSLDDYPAVMARLQRLWPEPEAAMHELESLLFRRDEGETFDLPAYNEVLFLYSLARDVSENPDLRDIQPSQVDLLLPLSTDDESPRPAAPLVDTMSIEPRPVLEKPLSLDLDVSVPGALGPAEVPRSSR
jgi:hypothetical protein